jgi:hypothetical protein
MEVFNNEMEGGHVLTNTKAKLLSPTATEQQGQWQLQNLSVLLA